MEHINITSQKYHHFSAGINIMIANEYVEINVGTQNSVDITRHLYTRESDFSAFHRSEAENANPCALQFW